MKKQWLIFPLACLLALGALVAIQHYIIGIPFSALMGPSIVITNIVAAIVLAMLIKCAWTGQIPVDNPCSRTHMRLAEIISSAKCKRTENSSRVRDSLVPVEDDALIPPDENSSLRWDGEEDYARLLHIGLVGGGFSSEPLFPCSADRWYSYDDYLDVDDFARSLRNWDAGRHRLYDTKLLFCGECILWLFDIAIDIRAYRRRSVKERHPVGWPKMDEDYHFTSRCANEHVPDSCDQLCSTHGRSACRCANWPSDKCRFYKRGTERPFPTPRLTNDDLI